MKEKEQYYKESRRFPTQYIICQQSTEKRSDQKEKMSQDMTKVINITAILQTKKAFEQYKWNFEYTSIVSIVLFHQTCVSQHIIKYTNTDLPLYLLIPRYSVITMDGPSDDCEQQADHRSQPRKRDILEHSKTA